MCRRITFLAVGLVAVQVAGFAEEPKKAPPSTKVISMIPDRNWTPAPGDHAEVHGGDAPSSPDYATFRTWRKFMDANDATGANGLYEAKAVTKLAVGTKLLVVKRYMPAPTISYVGDAANAGRVAFRESLGDRNLPKSTDFPLEVRVLDGEHKGQIRFVPEDSVARLIEGPKPKATKPKLTYFPKPADPAKVAGTMLRSAQSLEKAKKIPGAIGLYKDVVKNHPNTPEAKTAAERIEALSR